MGQGPGVPSQIDFNSGGVVIVGSRAEGFSIGHAPDSFTSAEQTEQERGGGVMTLAGTLYDYSNFTAFNTLMKNRTSIPVAVTYIGTSKVFTYNPCKLRVMPQFLSMQGATKVLIGTSAALNSDLDTTGLGWTDLGVPHGDLQASFETGGGTANRVFYYSYSRIDLSVLLPDVTVAAVEAVAAKKDSIKLAYRFGANVWLVFSNIRLNNVEYADQDGDMPLRTRLRATGVNTDWANLFAFHDGGIGGVVAEPGDFVFGYNVEVQGQYMFSQSDLLSII